jgi:hypothetical protein
MIVRTRMSRPEVDVLPLKERRVEAVSDRRTSMTAASLEQEMTAARHEHLVPGREIHMQDMRGYRFCEVDLITGTGQDNAIANIWNTTGARHPAPERFDGLDADTIARQNGAVRAWLSPVRHWMFDRLDIWEAGDDKTFGDLTGTWMGVAAETTIMQATVRDSYNPGYIYRNYTFTYNQGSTVYMLDAPDGEVFVMQSFARHEDPALSVDDLAHLASRLDLPRDWGFRAETLDWDLEVSSAKHDNLAHILQDDLHNVYQGSDVGRAFTKLCPEDSRW